VNVGVLLINIIKDELRVTLVTLGIIVYPAILDVNLSCRFADSYPCYQSSSVALEWLSSHVFECSVLLEEMAKCPGNQLSATKSIIMRY
jgi:hypothetical protein